MVAACVETDVVVSGESVDEWVARGEERRMQDEGGRMKTSGEWCVAGDEEKIGEDLADDGTNLNHSPPDTHHSPLLDELRANDSPILNSNCDAREKTRVKCLADVAGKPLEWVWDRVVPRGKLALITGESGSGKSTFVLDVVAAVTRGETGPSFSAESQEGSAGGAEHECGDSARWNKHSKSYQTRAAEHRGTSGARPTRHDHTDHPRGIVWRIR